LKVTLYLVLGSNSLVDNAFLEPPQV